MIARIDNDGKGQPPRILVVDDNPAALYATSRVLRAAGYEVIEAATGAEALKNGAAADLVVLDINLPDMDGFEVCRRLRENPLTANIPILHLSATFTNSKDLVQGVNAGADGFLTRPLEAQVLTATVRTLLFARHAEHIRRGLDARLRTMFNLVPVGIAVLDAEFRHENVNPAYCAITSRSREELIGRSFSEIMGGRGAEWQFDSTGSFGTVPQQPRRLTIERADGTVAHVELQMANERISDVRIVTVTDISRSIEFEAARERLLASERHARSEAESGNRLKEEFLATISHELRNPLNAILGWATVLNRMQDVPPPVKQGLIAIERNSKFQAKMISDLLDYASIAFGKVRLEVEVVDPYAIVEQVADTFAGQAEEAGVAVNVHMARSAAMLSADPLRLQQIIGNLLGNAIKFSDRGAAVEIHAEQAGKEFVVAVSDKGKGIESHFLPRLFDRFSQQDTSKGRSHGGLGLGLAIVKQLTELHGGTVTAHSDGLGAGSRFELRMPLSDAVAGIVPMPDGSSVDLDLGGLTVLIVDDDADARDMTARVLEERGASVLKAGNAEDAYTFVRSLKVDVLVSDIGMPGQDGYQLIRRIRNLGMDADRLPALALTAYTKSEDRKDALLAGFQEHVIKPLDPHALVVRIAALRAGK